MRKIRKPRKKANKGFVLSAKLQYISAGVLCLFFYVVFKVFVSSNVNIKSEKYYVYVPENTSADALVDTLKSMKLIEDGWSFKIMSYLASFSDPRPGLYQIEKDWGNYTLISQFKNQEIKKSVKINLPVRNKRKNVINDLCKKVHVNEQAFTNLFYDEYFLSQYDLDTESVYCLLIAGNFYTYSDISPEELFDRLYAEYLYFWNDNRLKQASDIGFSPIEAGILASIVYAETKKIDEMPLVAGLYINRLNNDMRLQADPTLVYASGENVKRVLNKHKNIKSNYNTYRKKGLPPGPVFTVPAVAIDAVLNYIEHKYIFFCAKDDFSGYHVFTETYDEHKKHATKYQKKLNALKITK
jgi:UPF0755 protein